MAMFVGSTITLLSHSMVGELVLIGIRCMLQKFRFLQEHSHHCSPFATRITKLGQP